MGIRGSDFDVAGLRDMPDLAPFFKTLFKKKYRHKKTGRPYWLLKKNILNATNAQYDQRMVMYTNGKEDFVREIVEFNEKFEEWK